MAAISSGSNLGALFRKTLSPHRRHEQSDRSDKIKFINLHSPSRYGYIGALCSDPCPNLTVVESSLTHNRGGLHEHVYSRFLAIWFNGYPNGDVTFPGLKGIRVSRFKITFGSLLLVLGL